MRSKTNNKFFWYEIPIYAVEKCSNPITKYEKQKQLKIHDVDIFFTKYSSLHRYRKKSFISGV